MCPLSTHTHSCTAWIHTDTHTQLYVAYTWLDADKDTHTWYSNMYPL